MTTAPEFPVGDTDELARRLDLPTDTATELLLSACLIRAGAMIEPHIDPTKVTGPGNTIYLEAVYQLAVKDWQIGVQGVNGLDVAAEYGYVPGATRGLVLSVWAYIAPLTPTGGLTV